MDCATYDFLVISKTNPYLKDEDEQRVAGYRKTIIFRYSYVMHKYGTTISPKTNFPSSYNILYEGNRQSKYPNYATDQENATGRV